VKKAGSNAGLFHYTDLMNLVPVKLPKLLLAALCLCFAACATRPAAIEEADDPPLEVLAPAAVPAMPNAEPVTAARAEEADEVPLAVLAPRPEPAPGTVPAADEVLIQASSPARKILDRVAEAQQRLRDVELQYAFTGSGEHAQLRGRPVVFAAWSEMRREWVIIHVEIPRPPLRWKPGRRPLPFTVRTPGIEAQHVRGTGAERLMFSFTRQGEPLKVYGRKFPVFDGNLVKRRQWREVAQTAQALAYLPATDDTLDTQFVTGGREYLLGTARRALDELRAARVPSEAYAGELLADVVPASLVAALAVIEQADDAEYVQKGVGEFEQVLSQYGLKRDEAFRYSTSRASALGPMQFTNARGNGTYALVVRRCAGANLDPNFERGATTLPNAMKAAICLLDMELSRMPDSIREPFRANQQVLGLFPVAAYNGGPRNVTKLLAVLKRLKLAPSQLRAATSVGQRQQGCPCLWKAEGTGEGERVRAVPLPRYNNENRWYLEKYQGLIGLLQ
jgi:hypothetical protein